MQCMYRMLKKSHLKKKVAFFHDPVSRKIKIKNKKEYTIFYEL